MLRAIRIQARQQMPNYRKPASFLIKETFPLPPYSSVIGMIHSLCNWNSYHPMRISVQGSYASTVSDYATNYVFGIPYDPTRHQKKVYVGDGKYDGINVGPKSYELLTDVQLILHIVPDDDSKIESILKALEYPSRYPSLGRYEDLLQIESLSIVNLELSGESVITKNDIYIPLDSILEKKNIIGTLYKLNKVYTKEKNRKKERRNWNETILVRHVCKGRTISSSKMYMDRVHKEVAFLG